jgi:small subunit ribosomal protein S17
MAEKKTKKTDETPVEETAEAVGEAPEAAAPSVDEGEPMVAVSAEADAPAPADEAVEEPAVEEPVAEEPAVEAPAAEAVVDEDVPAVDEAMIAVPEEAPAAEAEVAETGAETVDAPVAEVPQPEVEASTPAVPAAEPVTEEEPTAAAEAVVEEPVADAVEAAEPAPAPATTPAAAPAPAQQSTPKPKGKRLPRSLRRQRPRPKRGSADGARKPIVRLPKPEHERGRRNELQGKVVSAAMDKTIVVKVDTIKAHRRYQKVVRRSTKFHAHDETNQAKPGDVVRIVETRPLSKTKNWRLAEIVEAAK